ncbi:MAG TPA: SGNH/GDSL hydrolase family protein [Acetobacteraceae bacterium]|nr:SGNH/GDSL hydrolase family protein [Acetobacteraceae bacterium]
MKLLVAVAVTASFWCGSVQAAPIYDRLVVFGDSLSDVGNAFHLTSGDPARYHSDPPPVLGSPPFPAYYMGRASNGPNWVDQLADRLGLPRTTASLNGGLNYAYASAESGQGTNQRYPSPTYPPNPPLPVLRTGAQIDAFAAAHGRFKPDDLVTLWVGANDFKSVKGPADVIHSVDNIVQNIRALNDLGARTILVPNLVDLSKPPYFHQPGSPPGTLIRALVDLFNTTLTTRLQALTHDPAMQARIVPVDEFAAMNAAFADPAAHGFTNLTDPALTFDPATGVFSEVPDVGGYFWYDLIHPTTEGQAVFAEAAYATLIPAPSSLSLVLPGLAALVGLGSMRRSAAVSRPEGRWGFLWGFLGMRRNSA